MCIYGKNGDYMQKYTMHGELDVKCQKKVNTIANAFLIKSLLDQY